MHFQKKNLKYIIVNEASTFYLLVQIVGIVAVFAQLSPMLMDLIVHKQEEASRIVAEGNVHCLL
jgi:hypothetical protein